MLKLSEAKPGDQFDCFALLCDRQAGKTRDGSPFYRVSFRDDKRSVQTMIWLDGGFFRECDQSWKVGNFYRLNCALEESRYGLQLLLTSIREVVDADREFGFREDDFIVSSRFDPQKLYAELLEIASENLTDDLVKQLVFNILESYQEEISTYPAASRNHHAYFGGYIEHVVSVAKNSLLLAKKYSAMFPDLNPPLDVNLVLAGAILHDIGKVIELDGKPTGAEYTPQGRLIGHILLGRDLLREHAQQIEGFDEEKLLRLEHIIVSHQNLPEWGSPVSPHTLEALLVHYSDEIDAKVQMMATSLLNHAEESSQFTPKDNPMRRPIFKGLTPKKPS